MPLAPVTGKVTLDGQPLNEGTILFRPETGRSGRAKVENGHIVHASTYGIDDGIVLGVHKIAIQPIPAVPPPAPSRVDGVSAGGVQQAASVTRPPTSSPGMAIPKKYQDADLSGLTAEITDDENTLNLELTSQ